MIFATAGGRAAFVSRLEKAARRLGEARAREREGDARRWRMPGVLWPLFGPKFTGER